MVSGPLLVSNNIQYQSISNKSRLDIGFVFSLNIN
jgi:hypothetical protein